jgi:hypothetical protein
MAYVPARLYRGTPTTGSTTLFTAASNVLVKSVVVTNTTATAATLTLVVGGSDLCTAMSVPANGLVVIDDAVLEVMSSGETITGLQGTASALRVRVNGVTF